MTFFASTFDSQTGKLRYSNAGHNFPLLIRYKDGSYKGRHECLLVSGLRLGDQGDSEFKEEEKQLNPGDVVVWFTDGITECENQKGEEYGERRFVRSIKKHAHLPVEQLKEKVVEDAYAFFGDTPRADDVTLVIGKMSV